MEIFTRLEKLETESKDVGFYWPDHSSAIKQILDEVDEIKEVLSHSNVDQEHLWEELGDLLHAVCSLIFFCNFKVQKTLDKSLDKYEHRFYTMMEIAKQQGVENFNALSLDQMMSFWKLAKMIKPK